MPKLYKSCGFIENYYVVANELKIAKKIRIVLRGFLKLQL